MTTLACVLRSSKQYDARWVWKLKRLAQRWSSCGFQFRVLTDVPGLGRWAVPLTRGWPKWWSKLELFRPGALDGPVLYLDLDTLPVGPLDELLAYDGAFAMISDLFHPTRVQSGVMAFTPGDETAELWRAFSRHPEQQMLRFRGDGEWLREHAEPVRLQAIFPGQIVSLKREAKYAAPDGARLVCAHGQPKFDTPRARWAHHVWEGA